MSHPVLFLLVANFIVNVAAQRNITVDDGDPLITYTGAWSIPAPSQLDQGGAHHLTEDDASFAKFTFIGTAVYFMSPLWPYDVFTQVTLDSQPPVELNLSDPNKKDPIGNGSETVQSTVVWGSGPLSNTAHTLVVSKIPRPDRPFAIVDAIIYTVADSLPVITTSIPLVPSPVNPPSPSLAPPPVKSSPSIPPPVNPPASSLVPPHVNPPATLTSILTISTSPSSTAASPTNTFDQANTSSSTRVLPIALGTVLGSLGLFVISVVLWLCSKGRRRLRSEAWSITDASEGASSPKVVAPPPGPVSSNQAQPQIQHPYNPHPNYSYQQPYGQSPDVSWSNSGTQMSTTGVPLIANAQPTANYGNQPPPPLHPTQGFNPWVGVAPTRIAMQQPANDSSGQGQTFSSSGRYAPTMLSTITETSKPGGAVASNRTPAMGASPASFPAADLSYHTPPQETGGGNAARLYASDGSAGAPPAYQQQEQILYSHGSAGQLRPAGSLGTLNSGNKAGAP